MTRIIAITGFIGSGKDTIADYLVDNHGFKRESFAGTLKDSVAPIFGWDRVKLEGKTKEDREWREQVDEWWATRLGMPNLTPRLVLQLWGTEVCRHGFHDELWIASLENKLRKATSDIVISDCRFPNEMKAIKNAGGVVARVVRGQEPGWYNLALSANDPTDKNASKAKAELENLKVHISEWAWVGAEFDALVYNNSTLDDLYSKTEVLLKSQG